MYPKTSTEVLDHITSVRIDLPVPTLVFPVMDISLMNYKGNHLVVEVG